MSKLTEDMLRASQYAMLKCEWKGTEAGRMSCGYHNGWNAARSKAMTDRHGELPAENVSPEYTWCNKYQEAWAEGYNAYKSTKLES